MLSGQQAPGGALGGNGVMSVRFPDLQVLLPRSVEIGRIESAAAQQKAQYQQLLGEEQVQRFALALQQVQARRGGSARIDPLGREPRDQEQRRQKHRRAPGSHAETPPVAAEEHMGQRLDIRA